MPLSAIPADQLLSFIQDTAVATWSIGGDGYVLDVPQWSALTGQTPEEIEGDGWLTAIHPEDAERVAAAWQTAVAHGQLYNTDYRVRCADGVYRWLNARGTPIRSQDGQIERWVGVCLEIPGTWRFRGPSTTTKSDNDPVSLEPSVLRAARAMLDWSAADLCDRSGVSVSTIRRLEREDSEFQSRRSSTERLLRVFVEAGLSFTDTQGLMQGVRWAMSDKV